MKEENEIEIYHNSNNNNNEYKMKNKNSNEIINYKKNDAVWTETISDKKSQKNQVKLNENYIIFTDPERLFDYVINNDKYKKLFIEEIQIIIDTMEKIIYVPPYPILFGRLSVIISEQKKEEINSFQKNIDDNFYDGFGI